MRLLCTGHSLQRECANCNGPGGREEVYRDIACNAGELGSIPELGRSPGEGNGYPLQYLCLENPMDRGACGLQSMGLQRVGQDWVTNTSTFFQRVYREAWIFEGKFSREILVCFKLWNSHSLSREAWFWIHSTLVESWKFFLYCQENSTRSSAQCYVAAWVEGALRKKGYMYVWLSSFTVRLKLSQHC